MTSYKTYSWIISREIGSKEAFLVMLMRKTIRSLLFTVSLRVWKILNIPKMAGGDFGISRVYTAQDMQCRGEEGTQTLIFTV